MKIIYIRTSTLEQTPELQLRDISSLIKLEEVNVIYTDKQSAFKDNIERDNFEKLRQDIKQKKVNDLYVWAWDRIFRRRKKLIEFFQFCKIYNCKIHSYREKFAESINQMPEPFNEAMFDFMLQMLGYIAEEESQHKSDRVKMSVNKKDGITISHKGNKWGRKQISQQAIIKVLAIKKDNPNISLRDIAKQVLITDKNNNMKPISKSVVHKILVENLGKI